MVDRSWTKIASLYDGPRAVGGRIAVGGGRLRFEPRWIDRALKGRRLDVALAEIERLTLTRRSFIAPRRHLLVETTDGTRARFLVNDATKLLRRMEEEAREAGASPTTGPGR